MPPRIEETKTNIKINIDPYHKYVELKGDRKDGLVLGRLILGACCERPVEGALFQAQHYQVLEKREVMGIIQWYHAVESAAIDGEKYALEIKNRNIHISRADAQEIPPRLIDSVTGIVAQANEQVRHFVFEGGEGLSIGKPTQPTNIYFGVSQQKPDFFPYHINSGDLSRALTRRRPEKTDYSVGIGKGGIAIVRAKNLHRLVNVHTLNLSLEELSSMGIKFD